MKKILIKNILEKIEEFDKIAIFRHVFPDPDSYGSQNGLKSIIENSRSILLLAIELKGTTIRSYTSSLGVSGGYQDYLLVHTKKECPICKAALLKDSIGGRSTYYCQKCQV